MVCVDGESGPTWSTFRVFKLDGAARLATAIDGGSPVNVTQSWARVGGLGGVLELGQIYVMKLVVANLAGGSSVTGTCGPDCRVVSSATGFR